jgi:hypothetical protein
LFVRIVVLLVDDDEPEVGERREESDRAPIATFASRARIRRHSRRRSGRRQRECRTAIESPKRAANRPQSCGVSEISGTSTSTCRPAASTASAT